MDDEKKLEYVLNNSKAICFDVVYWEDFNMWIGQFPIIVNGVMQYNTGVLNNNDYHYVADLPNGHKVYVHNDYKLGDLE